VVGGELIHVDRARAAVRLIGEVREIGARTEPARRHLVDRLLGLLGCTIGAAVYDDGYARGLKGGIIGATLAGFDAQIMEVFTTHHTEGSDINPFHVAVMQQLPRLGDGVFTSTSDELVARRDWDGSMWINEYVRPARVDHFLGSMRLVGEHAGVGFGFMRAAGDRPFSPEDREVLHLVHLGVGPLYDLATPRSGLTPRMRETLGELLTGASDKEIAARLALSPHTVRQYVKAILRAHGVSSRGQLIARARR
jgi:DNA-binding CsgD family transcriptional regulator